MTSSLVTSQDLQPIRKILLLAANPESVTEHQLNREVRDICRGLERSKQRDKFHICQRWAVQPRDLQRAMLDESPQIVHFLGHSDEESGLFLEDEVGNTRLISNKALTSLFALFAQECKLECVVLRGCYSQSQAETISQHVPYVIGMSQNVTEEAALSFATGFYDAMGSGRAVEFAFDFGKVAMDLHSTGDSEMPWLLTNPVATQSATTSQETQTDKSEQALLRELHRQMLTARSREHLQRVLYETESYLSSHPNNADARLLQDKIKTALANCIPVQSARNVGKNAKLVGGDLSESKGVTRVSSLFWIIVASVGLIIIFLLVI